LQSLFVPVSGRTYWFSDEVQQPPDAYFACGVLLGQAVLHDVLIPSVFPWTLFDLLLRDLQSPLSACALPGESAAGGAGGVGGPTLAHLAAVSPEEADALQKMLEYDGDDIAEHFGDLGWERIGREITAPDGPGLSQGTKAAFVEAYVHWSLGEKIADRLGPLAEGFRAVLGGSTMIRRMVDARQLERIVCGGEVPVDVSAIRRRAALQGWDDEKDPAYIDDFWAILASLGEHDKRRFLVFVTASEREPLRGWDELRITIQKNGTGDERLPTAYTCFSLLLLPRYTTEEALRLNLLQAITNSEGFGLH